MKTLIYNKSTKTFSEIVHEDTYVVVYDQGDGDLDMTSISKAVDANDAKKKALDEINRGLPDADKAKMNDIKHCRLFKAGTQDYEIDDWFKSLIGTRHYSTGVCYHVQYGDPDDHWNMRNLFFTSEDRCRSRIRNIVESGVDIMDIGLFEIPAEEFEKYKSAVKHLENPDAEDPNRELEFFIFDTGKEVNPKKFEENKRP